MAWALYIHWSRHTNSNSLSNIWIGHWSPLDILVRFHFFDWPGHWNPCYSFRHMLTCCFWFEIISCPKLILSLHFLPCASQLLLVQILSLKTSIRLFNWFSESVFKWGLRQSSFLATPSKGIFSFFHMLNLLSVFVLGSILFVERDCSSVLSSMEILNCSVSKYVAAVIIWRHPIPHLSANIIYWKSIVQIDGILYLNSNDTLPNHGHHEFFEQSPDDLFETFRP